MLAKPIWKESFGVKCMYENDFVEEVIEDNVTDPIEILNWYRNLYYTEGSNTERGIMANAIGDLFMSLRDSDKKQIPMVVKSDGDDESDWVYCPVCLEILGDNEFVGETFYARNDNVYCQYCGQRLKEKQFDEYSNK